ncbi:MAG: hypothetical protein AAF356_12315 [Planctomycetota bacterium]
MSRLARKQRNRSVANNKTQRIVKSALCSFAVAFAATTATATPKSVSSVTTKTTILAAIPSTMASIDGRTLLLLMLEHLDLILSTPISMTPPTGGSDPANLEAFSQDLIDDYDAYGVDATISSQEASDALVEANDAIDLLNDPSLNFADPLRSDLRQSIEQIREDLSALV